MFIYFCKKIIDFIEFFLRYLHFILVFKIYFLALLNGNFDTTKLNGFALLNGKLSEEILYDLKNY